MLNCKINLGGCPVHWRYIHTKNAAEEMEIMRKKSGEKEERRN
jgi:hypothetical protein